MCKRLWDRELARSWQGVHRRHVTPAHCDLEPARAPSLPLVGPRQGLSVSRRLQELMERLAVTPPVGRSVTSELPERLAVPPPAGRSVTSHRHAQDADVRLLLEKRSPRVGSWPSPPPGAGGGVGTGDSGAVTRPSDLPQRRPWLRGPAFPETLIVVALL